MMELLNHQNRFFLVLGAWGSGTTAVTGVLDRLGAYSCPPFFNTNDPRTPCAYEPIYLRHILLHYIDEASLTIKGDRTALIENTRRWLQYTFDADAVKNHVVVMKHALLSLVLSEFFSLLSPKFILVDRPMEDIEASRLRRGWPPIYGSAGAQVLNKYIEDGLDRLSKLHTLEVLRVNYPELIEHPEQNIERLAEFTGLCDAAGIEAAKSFIRS